MEVYSSRPQSKAERKALRRQQKEERRIKVARQKTTKKWSTWIILSLLVVAGVWGVFRAVSGPASNLATTSDNDLLVVATDDHVKGDFNAPVTLIEYADFECEACGAYAPKVKRLVNEYKDKIRVVVRYFPLPSHKNSMPAALAVEAAANQGKFWEMHDVLFENQKAWGEKKKAEPAIFEVYAKQIGLNEEKFKQDVASPAVKKRIKRDLRSGQRAGVQGTPSFFLNGEKIQNPKSYDEFKKLIDAVLAESSVARVPDDKVDEHADFKVNINGEVYDFTQAQYQSIEDNKVDSGVYFCDGDGGVIHKRKRDISVGYFFKTLGISFDENCFVLDTGERYCTDESRTLKFLVNGQPNNQFGDYIFNDLDRILISFGVSDEAAVEQQAASVTDTACIYSGKCPERGVRPDKECAGKPVTENE